MKFQLSRFQIMIILLICIAGVKVHGQGEICNNAIDDDGDLQIDLFDSDCQCDSNVTQFDLRVTSLCFDKVILTVTGDYLSESYYQWYHNDIAILGAVFQELELSSNSLSGQYYVLVREPKACISSNYYNFNPMDLDYGIDLGGAHCNGSEVWLTARGEAESYEWSTGSNDQSIKISEPGIYSFSAIYNISGVECEYSEEIEVEEDCSCDFDTTPTDLICNGDFESITGCCFQVENNVSNCIENWMYVGGLNYYFTNNCGVTPQVITNTTLKDFKDDGFVGIFIYGLENSEFTGALGTCLQEDLKKDSSYTIQMDMAKDNLSEFVERGTLEFGIYGIPNCADMLVEDGNDIFCNRSIGQILLSSFDITDIGIYSFETFQFDLAVSERIEGIVIAPLCENNYDGDLGELLLVDNISLFQKPTPYQANLNVVFNDCMNGLVLEIQSEDNLTVQWYKDDELILGENKKTINIEPQDLGNYVYTPIIRKEGGHCEKLESVSWNAQMIAATYDTTTICNGTILDWEGISISENGTYEYIDSASICKRTAFLTVRIEDFILTNIDTLTTCSGEHIEFGGRILQEAGTYYDTIKAQGGCMEIIGLELETTNYLQGYLEVILCGEDSFQFHNEMLNEAGKYFDTIQRVGNCDSIIELNLSIRQAGQNVIRTEICEGQKYEFGTQFIQVGGTYWDTLTTEGSCDSIVELDLVVLRLEKDSLEYSICDGELLILNTSDTITESGVYYDSIYNADSCLEMDVHVIEILDRILLDTIYQIIEEGSYFLYGFDTIYTEGVYVYKEMTENGCLGNQYIVVTIQEEVNDLKYSLPNIFSPNGDGIHDSFFISIEDDSYTSLEMRVYDRWGKEIYSINAVNGIRELGWDGTFHNHRVQKGIYVYLITIQREGQETITVTGSVTLI